MAAPSDFFIGSSNCFCRTKADASRFYLGRSRDRKIGACTKIRGRCWNGVRVAPGKPVSARGYNRNSTDKKRNLAVYAAENDRPKRTLRFVSDELNACSQEIQKAFYNLIHERRIGEYHLPRGKRCDRRGKPFTGRRDRKNNVLSAYKQDVPRSASRRPESVAELGLR